MVIENMAKREEEGSEEDALELKNKLMRLVKTIVDDTDDDDDFTVVNTADEAISTLSALKNLKCRRSRRTFSDKLDDFALPLEFRCPISKQLMSDPVILSTGQVFSFLLSILHFSVFLLVSY